MERIEQSKHAHRFMLVVDLPTKKQERVHSYSLYKQVKSEIKEQGEILSEAPINEESNCCLLFFFFVMFPL